MTKEEKDAKYRKVKLNRRSHLEDYGWLHGFTLTSESTRSLGPDFHITMPAHGVAIIETEKGSCILAEFGSFTFID